MSNNPKLHRSTSFRLIRWLCREELQEEIEGNLLEFKLELQRSKSRNSTLKYWLQVLNYLRPSTFKKFKNSTFNSMFVFNPILTLRQLAKRGSSTIINILGFTLSLVCIIFLYFYIDSELSTDSFQKDGNKIYRTIRFSDLNSSPYDIGVTSVPFARFLANDFPNSIESFCRAYPTQGLMSIGDKDFLEKNLLFADSNFFEFFSYPLSSGQAGEVLNDIHSAVISEDVAKKYFGDENPIGKIIRHEQGLDLMVTGILDDFPSKSHLNFDIVLNINIFKNAPFFTRWWSNLLVTYLKIETPQEAEYVNSQLGGFMDEHFGDAFRASGTKVGLKLEALSDIYFNRMTRYDVVAHGDKTVLNILILVGIAILFIACFNYINLAIAQSLQRAKEVSMRKVLGSQKTRLILQMLGESITILFFSVGLAIGLTLLIQDVFMKYFELDFSINWFDRNVLLFFSGLITVLLLISGVYPAYLLASFNPNLVLRSGKLPKGRRSFLRKGLVTLQFVISIVMITSTLLISRQMKYIQNKNLGFDREAVILVNFNNPDIRRNLEAFKTSVEKQTNVRSITAISGEPGGFHDAGSIRIRGKEGTYRMRIAVVDADYFSTFKIDLIQGRVFSDSLETDLNQTAIINKSALEALGMSPEELFESRGDIAVWGFEDFRFVGITEDFNYSSLRDNIEPLIMLNAQARGRFAIKVNPLNLQSALAEIQDSWTKFSPSYPMEYDFLDDSIARLYLNEAKQNRLFSVFSGISIFLACLGVFGLATYSAKQRQKELGIRKILGASIGNIIGLISKEFLVMIFLASVISIPIAWYFISTWLEAFAYHINMDNNWVIFALGSVCAGIVAMLSISIRTYKAAALNPTESIRYE